MSLGGAIACGDAATDDFVVMDAATCIPNEGTNGLEECNGIDDDCDGTVDEGPSGAPLKQPCSSACGGGTEECVEGTWQFCSAPMPQTEVCNGIDDDCDEGVDEDCDCVHGETRPCGSDVGACRAGIQQCVDGTWNETCHGEVEPAPMEICSNGIDDDCNDAIDDGCQCTPGETQVCGTDVGECTAGELTCDNQGQWDMTCVGEVEPEAEVCDGLDNDCDGEEDWNTATGFGWQADSHENNDSCAGAKILPNAVDGGAWIQVPVSDPSDLTTFPTVYPPGDVDWYGFKAETVSHGACFPGASQCAFVLVVQLELAGGAVPEDYEVCMATTNNCGQINDNTLFCSDINDFVVDASSYLIGVKWGGTCGADDSRDVRVVVRNAGGASACEYYQLHARFYFDDSESCP